MSYLKQFARKPGKGVKTETITSRVPTEIYDQFKRHCDNLGLSLSEAVYLLVKRETELISKGIQENTYEKQTVSIPSKNEDVLELSFDDKAINSKNDMISNLKTTDTNKKSSSKAAPRSLKKQFELDGKVPCPICNTWQSSANFSRHAKSHNKTTEEIFEQHTEKAREMYQTRIEERGLLT